MKRFRVYAEVIIEANSHEEAVEQAIKLKKMLKNPLVKMTLASDGVILADGDGRPNVLNPQLV
jgi:hypothetical protein